MTFRYGFSFAAMRMSAVDLYDGATFMNPVTSLLPIAGEVAANAISRLSSGVPFARVFHGVLKAPGGAPQAPSDGGRGAVGQTPTRSQYPRLCPLSRPTSTTPLSPFAPHIDYAFVPFLAVTAILFLHTDYKKQMLKVL